MKWSSDSKNCWRADLKIFILAKMKALGNIAQRACVHPLRVGSLSLFTIFPEYH